MILHMYTLTISLNKMATVLHNKVLFTINYILVSYKSYINYIILYSYLVNIIHPFKPAGRYVLRRIYEMSYNMYIVQWDFENNGCVKNTLDYVYVSIKVKVTSRGQTTVERVTPREVMRFTGDGMCLYQVRQGVG